MQLASSTRLSNGRLSLSRISIRTQELSQSRGLPLLQKLSLQKPTSLPLLLANPWRLLARDGRHAATHRRGLWTAQLQSVSVASMCTWPWRLCAACSQGEK